MSAGGDDFWAAWAKATDDRRFRYRLNGRLVGLLVAMQLAVWAYFAFTVVRVGGLPGSLIAFPGVFGAVTLLLVFFLARWRAFCVMSGVIIESDALRWRERGREVRVLWRQMDAKRLQLKQGSQPMDLSSHIELGLSDGQTEKLIVTTPFAWLENLEGLLSQVLSRLGGKPGGGGRPSRRRGG